ncbi:Xaa-Pro dipeptidase [Iodidimonas muriae]|uniref:Xaa-Pro dipeptidase n=1 Tax=Iodidimonas muriae TaxID=261467 RepID=A0ABQ2LBM3_9PROT|nr:amidohydrolase family protein [Iodidimonas muriae]GGO09489.1 Xaa-Pro dipeptidase [Iodidimonas muriae]
MRMLILVFGLFLMASSAKAHTIIHAGTVITDPRETPLQEQSIIIADGKIERIEAGYLKGDPAHDTVIDLRSATVLPGLIDMHTHILFELSPTSALQRLKMSATDAAMQGALYAKRTLEAGFTTVRDLGDEPEAIYGLRDAIHKGYVAGPRIIAAGNSISGTGGHADVDGYNAEIVHMLTPDTICDGPYDCRRAVRETVKYGADVIKITSTGGVLSDSATGLMQQMKDDEIAEIISTAHSLGRKVAAHAHGADGINAALEAGIDSIEHGSMLDERSITLFKESEAYLVPTLLAGKTVVDKIREQNFLPPAIREKALGLPPIVMENVGKAYKGGVKIAFGTDSGVSTHGTNAQEFLLMRDLGMSNSEMIAAATVNAADLLGMSDRLGTLAPGKAADIIAVSTNPLENIEALLDVGFVMGAGRVAKNTF